MAEEKIDNFNNIKDKPIEEIGIKSTMLPIAEDVPSVHSQNILGGLGGKYLALQNETISFNTSVQAWQETGLEKTVNVENRRVMLLFTGSVYSGASATVAYLTFSVDDDEKGSSAEGLLWATLDTNGQRIPVSMVFITDVLVGSHTFKVEIQSGDGNTVNLEGSAYSTFIVIELSN